MNQKEKRICIIGAGCSGITAIKNMLQVGLRNVVCYEQNPWIGGNWKFTAEVSHSSVCSTTHIISSKKLSEYMDYPMPDHYPDYPSHQQVLSYFESYVDHFGLEQYIQFNTKVDRAEKIENEKWKISLSNGTVEIYDYLLVANGHHSVPSHPELNGTYTGEYIHSHSFKNNVGFEDKRVLVMGIGNSGSDCAVETSRVAAYVAISVRTPQYVIPKFFMGIPTDVLNKKMLWVPEFIRKRLLRTSLRMQIGKYDKYNLPEPEHRVTEAHPTLSSELLEKIRHGKVNPKPAIEKVEGKEVTFTNGTKEEYDVIIAATGYKIITSFFDPDFLDYSNADRVPLYLRMFHPKHPTLMFIGLFQPQGAIWSGSDLQSKLAGNYIVGNWSLPSNVLEMAEKDSDDIDRRFLKRKRHTIEVDYHDFAKKITAQIPSSAPKWNMQKTEQTV